MNIVKKIKAFFILLKADSELKRAAAKADSLYKRNNIRYYVLPNARHELRVWCWADIKRMRRAGLFSARATLSAFLFESFYHTPDRFGAGALTDKQRKGKRRAWLNYVAQVRHLLH